MKREYFDKILKIWCLILLHQTSITNAQFRAAFRKELNGLTNTYKNQGFVPTPNCTHEKRRPILKFKNLTKFTSCLREIDKQGRLPRHRDQDKRSDEIIRDHGYYLVTYNNLTSPDGYIQTLFRITGSPKSPPRRGKTGVLMFHGMIGASDAFLLLGERSLPFKLANAGYEVWLVNSRGTDYSMKHVKYDPNWNLEYWNFSYHEMAIYDVPMMIDLMLAETGTQKVFYIGHSLGAMVYPVALAEQPDLNNKILASFSFGSGGVPFHTTSPAKMSTIILDLEPRIQNLIFVALRGRITGGSPIMNYIRSRFCVAAPLTCRLCGTFASAYTGHYEPEIKYTYVPYLASQAPNSVGLKVLLHGAQNYRNCEFHKYDYGPEKNLELYGQPEPPLYNLQNVRAPLHIYYGENDDFTTVDDVMLYRNALPPGTVRVLHKIGWKNFNHFDFIFGLNVDTLVYDNILEDMKSYA